MLRKHKVYKTTGTDTMVLASESLFVRSCHECSAYLSDDVVHMTTMGTNYSFTGQMISFTVRNELRIRLKTVFLCLERKNTKFLVTGSCCSRVQFWSQTHPSWILSFINPPLVCHSGKYIAIIIKAAENFTP